MKVGRLALDGTKIKANVSRHKVMSYGPLKKGVGSASSRSFLEEKRTGWKPIPRFSTGCYGRMKEEE